MSEPRDFGTVEGRIRIEILDSCSSVVGGAPAPNGWIVVDEISACAL